MKIINYLFVSAIALFMSACTQAPVPPVAPSLFQWRGADRAGIYMEANLLKSWPEAGPKLVWLTEELGSGYGSPVVTGDALYITGTKDSTAILFAYKLDGKLLWKSEYGKEWVKSYPGSRSAPTVVDSLVYVTSGLGNLYCFNAKKGYKEWSVDLLQDLQGELPMFGISESPLIDSNKVFLTPGGKDTNVVALDRFTGKILWICKGKSERPGYNSPALIKLKDRNILAVFTAYSLLGIDAKTGELLWVHEQDNIPVEQRSPGMGDTHSNTVLFDNGSIYYIAGDGNCGVRLELSKDGKQITQTWRNKAIDNYMGGVVKLGDYLYTCTTARKDMRSVDARTGQMTDSLKCDCGTLIAADSLLYYYNQKGEVCLIKPTGSKLEKISSFKIAQGSKEHFAHPVIANGMLYIRHGNALMAYDIKKG